MTLSLIFYLTLPDWLFVDYHTNKTKKFTSFFLNYFKQKNDPTILKLFTIPFALLYALMILLTGETGLHNMNKFNIINNDNNPLTDTPNALTEDTTISIHSESDISATLKILKPKLGDLVIIQPTTQSSQHILKHLYELIHKVNSNINPHQQIFVASLNPDINISTLSKQELSSLSLKTNNSLLHKLNTFLRNKINNMKQHH
jgi:hypothetical protein